MRFLLLTLILPLQALAQIPTPPVTAACGPSKTAFSAHEANTSLAPATPDAGKALVYFIQDRGELAESQHFTIKIGLDGAWVGAYKNNSVLEATVDPGEHHVCANVQSNFAAGSNLAFAHFTAEAGKIYYFRTRFLGAYPGRLDLDRPDSDQAKYLIATYPASISKQKK